MANRFYNINRGDNRATIDTSTESKDIELRIDDTKGVNKKDAIIQVKRILRALEQDTGYNAI